jgi:hypothetical protein
MGERAISDQARDPAEHDSGSNQKRRATGLRRAVGVRSLALRHSSFGAIQSRLRGIKIRSAVRPRLWPIRILFLGKRDRVANGTRSAKQRNMAANCKGDTVRRQGAGVSAFAGHSSVAAAVPLRFRVQRNLKTSSGADRSNHQKSQSPSVCNAVATAFCCPGKSGLSWPKPWTD